MIQLFFIKFRRLYSDYSIIIYGFKTNIHFYLKTKKEALIIAGFGDGDVIVLTILIGIIGLNVFIFIFTIALIVHVLSYVIYFYERNNKCLNLKVKLLNKIY